MNHQDIDAIQVQIIKTWLNQLTIDKWNELQSQLDLLNQMNVIGFIGFDNTTLEGLLSVSHDDKLIDSSDIQGA